MTIYPKVVNISQKIKNKTKSTLAFGKVRGSSNCGFHYLRPIIFCTKSDDSATKVLVQFD